MHQNKKNILFTFDYELFLGSRSGSVDKCCIEPTNKLIDIFDQFSIKNVIFFVDTTYLIRLSENQDKNSAKDFQKIKDQLQTLVKKGHHVFPHIHPHWLDAIYLPEINQWDLKNNSRYRFNHINSNEREYLFKKSIQLLNEILLPVDPNYKPEAYRAGGWCIQPFKDFQPFFDAYGIKNEFSVLRGMANNSDNQYYDFSKTPKKNIYSFENDPLIEDVKGNYTEFVISTIPFSDSNQLLNKILLKVLWHLKQRGIGDGIGSANAGGKSNSVNNPQTEMASVELLTDVRLPLYWNHIENNNYLQFISHPKMLSSYNLKVFRRFLTKFTRRYEFETDFRKMIETH